MAKNCWIDEVVVNHRLRALQDFDSAECDQPRIARSRLQNRLCPPSFGGQIRFKMQLANKL